MNAEAEGISPALAEREVTTFSIDSREAETGDVFFALSQPEYSQNGFNGEFDDSTQFAAAALGNGAAACVLRRDRYAEHAAELEKYQDRLIFVDDAIAALQRLAHGVYQEWGGTVAAVTGSAGKTTAKELTAAVFEYEKRKILRNIKNYNNGLGHPLTVLRLAADSTYDAAVLEMGMSTPLNEIARLCRITPPDIAIELNVLPVHVEHLGSIENVAKAKAELIEGMKPGGTAVLNADDERVAAMAELANGRVLTYGIANQADVSAVDIRFEGFGRTTFTLRTPDGEVPVTFFLNGRHNILNALAAAAAGIAYGIPVKGIAERLSAAVPPPQRGEVLKFAEGFTVINDSYNSNPAALLAVVRTMAEMSQPHERLIVVAGEMLELGSEAAAIHRQTGVDLAKTGVHRLIGVRGLAAQLVDGARSAGLSADLADNAEQAGEMLSNEIRAGDVVLIKGSRGVRTENALAALLRNFRQETTDR